MTPYYSDDYATIYHGDCREILPGLNAEVLVTDPPYGIGYEPTFKKWSGKPSGWEKIEGDDVRFDPTLLLGMNVPLVIWGATYFSDRLPIGDWLVWDKRGGVSADKMFGTSIELAWMRGTGKVIIKRLLHGGVINADSVTGNNAIRSHPTQKPIALMAWCIKLAKTDGVILDPYVGSGTTLVAAKNLGRKSIGIEIEERYCEIAAEWLSQGVLDLKTVAPTPARV